MKRLSIIIGAYILLASFFIYLTPKESAVIYDAATYISTSRIPNLYQLENLFIDKGYPLLLRFLQQIFGYENIFSFQAVNYLLWSVSALLIYLSLKINSSRYSYLGGLLMLFSPLFLSFSPKVYSEPLAAFSVSLGIFSLNLVIKKNNLLSHILLAISTLILMLTKSIFIPLIIIIVLVLLFVRRPIPIIWIIASIILSIPGLTSSMGGGRSLYNLAIQSSKLDNSTVEIVSCFPYYLSYPLGRVLAPKFENICHHNDPDPDKFGYDRNSYVIAAEKRDNHYSYQDWIIEILQSPLKYSLVLLVSMGNIVFIEGIYPSVLVQLPVILQILLFSYKIILSLTLWYLAIKKKSPWLIIPLGYFFFVVGNFPVEARYFYPLIPCLYFSALLDKKANNQEILHVSTWLDGGAGIMAKRLSSQLQIFGTKSTLYSAENQGIMIYTWARLCSYFDAIISKIFPTQNPIFRSYNLFPTFHPKLHFDESISLFHLHWIGAGFINLLELALLNKPIIWTLHDLWPILGSEHMTGRNVDPDNYPNSIVKKLKQNIYRRLSIHFVVPSSYMYQQFISSDVGKNLPVSLIPNGINLAEFPKKKTKKINRNSIFFAAMNASQDKNKGLDLLVKALHKIKKRRVQLTLRLAGTNSFENNSLPKWIKVECLGNLNPQQMSKEYVRSDITVVPSRIESFSLITLESMAVGTPVVAFAVGGIVDLIDHKTNGYLAKPYSITDFAKGIDYLLSSPSKLNIVGKAANIKVRRFDIRKVSRKYQKLYLQILSSINPNSIAMQSLSLDNSR